MCKGEINQAACRYKVSVTVDEYYQNIYGKTASMFVTVCKIGGHFVVHFGRKHIACQALADAFRYVERGDASLVLVYRTVW